MTRKISLDGLDKRHYGLTPAIAEAYREAASACLSRHHSPSVVLTLSDNGVESAAEMAWIAPDPRVLAAWANRTDTTEAGAYACVIAGVEELRGFVAVRRAETGTGADYYVGADGVGKEDLENCLRLEVSGVDAGDRKEVAKRLVGKVQQARDGSSSLPALAGVMGFAAKLLVVQDVLEEP
jgi:hypothetical protein